MSGEFFALQADFAINDATGPDRWATRGMLTDYAFRPWHTFDATAVLENSKLLAATPHCNGGDAKLPRRRRIEW